MKWQFQDGHGDVKVSRHAWRSASLGLADTASVAAKRLRTQRPDAGVWLMRVGYQTLRHFGGSALRKTGWLRGS